MSARPDNALTEGKQTIILYTKNGCADCDKARDFLTDKKTTFIEYNIDLDRRHSSGERRSTTAKKCRWPFSAEHRFTVFPK
jgi:hypothetical protein